MERSYDLLASYGFRVSIFFKHGDGTIYKELPVVASAIRISARGFELWRTAITGRNLFNELLGACGAKVVLYDHLGIERRTIEMDISLPKYLPFGTNGGGFMDAAGQGVVTEGVIFRVVRGVIARDALAPSVQKAVS